MDMFLLDAFRSHIVFRLTLLSTLVSILGCGGTDSQPNYADLGIVEISGTIRLDGNPLANAYVQFENEDRTFSYADADSQGRYRLRFDSNTYGTIPGKKIVRIRMGSTNPEESGADSEVPEAKPSSVAASPIKIPECYNRKSVLTKEVTSTESNVDFDLKSDGLPPGAP
jgi:hypothetical protein